MEDLQASTKTGKEKTIIYTQEISGYGADKSDRGKLEAGEDKKLMLTLTIFTFALLFANEEDEDLPKSGIRSPGRGEDELGSVQITQEMVNKSLGELKTDTKHYGPDGNMHTRGI